MARGLTIVVAFLCLIVMAVSAGATPSQPEGPGRRVALVVGNSNYVLRPLALSNPKNDAEDVGAALKALGFDVIASTDLDLTSFDAAVRSFKEKAKGAEVALFFYAGHAVQSDHVNYFIPVDANITQEAQLKRLSVSVLDIEEALSGVQGVQVMILDSCRDNPFSSLKLATRGIGAGELSRGLERIVVSSGDSVVLYSTRANDVASDGAPGARNSPFSKVLVDVLKRPGEHDLRSMLWDVAARVKSDSGGKQSPELTMSLSGDYTFNLVNDRLEWENVRTSLDPRVFRTFAARFPDSPFRKQAEQYATVLEQQEYTRRRETEARTKKDDQARQAKDKADRDARTCRESLQRLDLLRSGADQGGLEKLQRENACPSMQGSIDIALEMVVSAKRKQSCDRLDGELNDYSQSHNAAGLTAIQPEAAPCPGLPDRIARALSDIQTAERQQKEAEEQQRQAQQRQREAEDRQKEAARQQAMCDEDAGRLKDLTNGQGAHRTDDIAALGISARCEPVRNQALALADDLHRQEAQAAHDAKQRLACTSETKSLRDAVTAGPRSTIESLGRSHVCETLDVPGALAQFDDLAAKRRQQAMCDDDAGRLKDLVNGQGARRTDDIAALGASARCESVRAQALAMADDLRRQEAQAAHDAQQRLACSAEGKTIRDAIAAGSRTAIEGLGRAHDCETLDVPGALAQFDDLADKRRQEALKACASVDIAGLAGREDDKGLADAAAKCPSRADDVASALQGLKDKRRLADACRREGDQLQRLVSARQPAAVADLQKQATCPTLDFSAALASIATANCTSGLKALGSIRDDDEAGLRNYAGNPDLCTDLRTAAQKRLDKIETARRDDAACDQQVADATGRGDIGQLKGLLAQDACVRRRDVIAREIDTRQKDADRSRQAKADCDTGMAAVGRVADSDEASLRRYAGDAKLCPPARTAAASRLDRIASARQSDAACDQKVADASSRGDADALKGLQDEEDCARRRDVIARAIDDQLKKADQQRLARADCEAGTAAVGRIALDDEGALHRYADDPALCPAARSAATARLHQVAALHDEADRACDTAVAAAVGDNDVERITQLGGDPVCVRRQAALGPVLAKAQQARTRDGQVRLADLGCYPGPASGAFDKATMQAVTWYRKVKHEDGAPPTAFSGDFIRELSAQSAKVCVQEAALTPPDAPAQGEPVAPPIVSKPLVPAPDVEAPRPPRVKAEPPAAPRPRQRPRIQAAPEPREQPEPRVRPRPAPRQYVEPAPRTPRPAAPQREAPPAVAQGHIFY